MKGVNCLNLCGLNAKSASSVGLTLKIWSDQIWVAGYFGQPPTSPDFTIFSTGFLCNFLKS